MARVGFHSRLSPVGLIGCGEVAGLIVCSALSRRESGGLHFTLDYPESALVAEDTVLVP